MNYFGKTSCIGTNTGAATLSSNNKCFDGTKNVAAATAAAGRPGCDPDFVKKVNIPEGLPGPWNPSTPARMKHRTTARHFPP